MGEWALGRHLSVYAKIIILNAWDNSEYFTKELSHDLAIKYMCPINVSYSQCVNANSLPSCLFVTLGTVPPAKTYLSMGFSRQEYWSGLSCPPPGDLPDPWIKPTSLMSLELAGGFFTTSATWEARWEEKKWCDGKQQPKKWVGIWVSSCLGKNAFLSALSSPDPPEKQRHPPVGTLLWPHLCLCYKWRCVTQLFIGLILNN